MTRRRPWPESEEVSYHQSKGEGQEVTPRSQQEKTRGLDRY